jgi:hypothetical protein
MSNWSAGIRQIAVMPNEAITLATPTYRAPNLSQYWVRRSRASTRAWLLFAAALCALGCHDEAGVTGPAPPARSGAFLWGMVVAESGVCIEGATATVVRGQGLGRSVQQKTPCDAWGYDGGFEFWDLTPGVEMTIRASAEGYAAREMTVFPVSPGTWFSYVIFALSRIP